MKNLIWVFLFATAFVKAESNKVSVYLQFEEAYMSNDASLFAPWLSEDYKIRQTLHIPGVGADTRPITKEQLLAGMKQVGKPSSMPRSKAAETVIESSNEISFCATSNTVNQTVVGGKNYEEKEIRKVCFDKINEDYKVTVHNIDVHYSAL